MRQPDDGPRGADQTTGKLHLPVVWEGPDAYAPALAGWWSGLDVGLWRWAGGLPLALPLRGQVRQIREAVWQSRRVGAWRPEKFFVKSGVLPRLLLSDGLFSMAGGGLRSGWGVSGMP